MATTVVDSSRLQFLCGGLGVVDGLVWQVRVQFAGSVSFTLQHDFVLSRCCGLHCAG